jgi:hypothetical protein
MMKKMIIILILGLFIVNYTFGQDWEPGYISPGPYSDVAPEWPYFIDTVPYNNYSYTEKDQYNRSKMTILGWSRDGKILVFYNGNMEYTYYIIDLVEDAIVIDCGRTFEGSLNYAEEGVVEEYIRTIAHQYNIESIAGTIGEFPYTGGDGKTYNIVSKETLTQNDHTKIDAYIYQNFSPNKMKLVNTIATVYFWNDYYKSKLKFWYAKSPFENRLAVIAIVPMWRGGAYESRFYDIGIFGSNLDVGFNMDRH